MVGKKILYAIAIGLSGLVVLLSLAGIVGGWAVRQRVERAAVATLQVVEKSAGAVQLALTRVDQPLATLQSSTADLADASRQLSQSVSDKGLIRTLLPEEKDQQLVATATSVRDTLAEVRDTISTGIDLYHSIDRLPFLSLPHLNSDQLDKIEGGVTQVQTLVATAKTQISGVRAGTAGAVDKVTGTVDQLSAGTADVRSRLKDTGTKMAALQAMAVDLQERVPNYLLAATIVQTLLFAFVIYTQVEVIRLFIVRWRRLGGPAETPDPPAP
jgi:uncharacterized phage infection (PIP) family protein YhgE